MKSNTLPRLRVDRRFLPALLFLGLMISGCPTPGGGSGGPPQAQVPLPVFSPPPGTYSGDRLVTFTPLGHIHFTTDGTTPNESSSLCSSRIPVSGHGTTMTIKAIAQDFGQKDSEVATATYTIDYHSAALWARSVSTAPAGSTFNSTAVDSGGNLYAVASIGTGTYTFGSGVTATGGSAVVKYDSSGTAQWARTVTTGGSNFFYDVTVDPNGYVLVAGLIGAAGTYDFGGGVSLTGNGNGATAVVVKYDSSGTAVWARKAGTTVTGYSSLFTSVAVDSSSNVYAAGGVNGPSVLHDFGNGKTAIGSGSYNTVVVKYDSLGTALWAQTVSTGSSSIFDSVAVDSGGNVYCVGSIGGTWVYTFAAGVTAAGSNTSSNQDNAVIVKYDTSGTAVSGPVGERGNRGFAVRVRRRGFRWEPAGGGRCLWQWHLHVWHQRCCCRGQPRRWKRGAGEVRLVGDGSVGPHRHGGAGHVVERGLGVVRRCGHRRSWKHIRGRQHPRNGNLRHGRRGCSNGDLHSCRSRSLHEHRGSQIRFHGSAPMGAHGVQRREQLEIQLYRCRFRRRLCGRHRRWKNGDDLWTWRDGSRRLRRDRQRAAREILKIGSTTGETKKIGLGGFEPPTPCTPSKYAKPTALQPDLWLAIYHPGRRLSRRSDWTDSRRPEGNTHESAEMYVWYVSAPSRVLQRERRPGPT